MGIRSFLINFNNEKEIRKFLQFKDLISKIIADYYFLVEEKKVKIFSIGQMKNGTNLYTCWLNLP